MSSHRSYSHRNPIIQPRDSGVPSDGSSASSRSSQSSQSSGSSGFGGRGHTSSQTSRDSDYEDIIYRRVPDNDKFFISTTVASSRCGVVVHNHRKSRYSDERRDIAASAVSYENYKPSNYALPRDEGRGGGSGRRRPCSPIAEAGLDTTKMKPLGLKRRTYSEATDDPLKSRASKTIDGGSIRPQNSKTHTQYFGQTEAPSNRSTLTGTMVSLSENADSNADIHDAQELSGSTVGINEEVLKVFRLAGKVVVNCRKACGLHDPMTTGLKNLYATLRHLKYKVASLESQLGGPDDSCKEDLKLSVEGCSEVLSLLDQCLEEYKGSNEEETQLLRKFRVDISACNSAITLQLNLIAIKSHAGIKNKLFKVNEEYATPDIHTTYIAPILAGHGIPEYLSSSNPCQGEGVEGDLSFASSSDSQSSKSEQNGSDTTSEELSCRLEDIHVDGKQVIYPFSIRLARLCQQDAGDYHKEPSCQKSTSLGSTSAAHHTARSPLLQRKRQRNDDREDSDKGNDRNHQPPSQYKSPLDEPTDRLKFACPFRKHNPSNYSIYSHRSSHQIILHCERCWQTFDNQENLTAHRTVDATEICQVKSGYPPDGLTPDMERKLRSRKKAHRNQTEEDRWREIYRIIFPDEDVPSPYFEPLQDEPPLSPDSRELANYEVYVRRELPRLVRASVLEVFSREMQPVEASLIANLVDTIQECQASLFRSYSERMGQDQRADIPSSSMGDVLSLSSLQQLSAGPQHPFDEGNSMHTSSDFLSAAFQQPPSIQNTVFEPNLQNHDPMHNLQVSHTSDTSLSSLSDNMFSRHGYSSEYTMTTINSQSEVTNSTCHSGKPKAPDIDSTQQDWNNEPWAEWFSAD
ncbi:hypothetical protein N431DRAFT_553617 [Stipitochalara longipes BDJ]|nr:hypothetical protein N431DRAFT_553617 [Stipitochalara longipes BDJ]